MLSEKSKNQISGVLLIALFSIASNYIGDIPFIKNLGLSPMIIGILLGMIYANTLRSVIPNDWGTGIKFCTKQILRTGIILYGFKLTFNDLSNVGMPAIIIDALVVTLVLIIGTIIGRLLKVDKDTALLTSTGSAICGAAAVLGAESIIKSEPHKTAVAVSTVVIFGTLSMFLYPFLYKIGVFNFSTQQMGIMTGSTIHEVAHAVGAGNAMGGEIADISVIVKMIRVMMLVPVLIIFSYIRPSKSTKGKITVPWFAIGFILVIIFNSFNFLPTNTVKAINSLDLFLLTMAMTALGVETSWAKLKQSGFKPFILALFLYFLLIFGGYALVKYLYPIIH